MDMDGFFLDIAGEQKMPKGKMMFHGVNGWDPTTKKFVRTDYDSMGGMFNLTSVGWEGDKMVFNGEGTMMGQKMKIRHTMTKKGDSEFASSFEGFGPDGKPMPMGDDVCKKAAAAPKK
jgi:hypothetical protein